MLIVASDISTEIYFSRVSQQFRQAKLEFDGFDGESALQLYAALLILGFYAVSLGCGIFEARSLSPLW